MGRQGRIQVTDVLTALGELDDATLHAVIARAQGLLLDRPARPGHMDTLSVEIVEPVEGHLLAAYRALEPCAQRQVCAYVENLARSRKLPAPLDSPPSAQQEPR